MKALFPVLALYFRTFFCPPTVLVESGPTHNNIYIYFGLPKVFCSNFFFYNFCNVPYSALACPTVAFFVPTDQRRFTQHPRGGCRSIEREGSRSTKCEGSLSTVRGGYLSSELHTYARKLRLDLKTPLCMNPHRSNQFPNFFQSVNFY